METYNIKGCIVYLPEKNAMTSYLDSQSKSDPKPEILSSVYTGNRIQSDGRNACGIVEKTTL